jgi:hypothetical protein
MLLPIFVNVKLNCLSKVKEHVIECFFPARVITKGIFRRIHYVFRKASVSIFWFWAYLMTVIPETYHAHWIWYLHSYYNKNAAISYLNYFYLTFQKNKGEKICQFSKLHFFEKKNENEKNKHLWVRKNLPLVLWQLMNLVWDKVVHKFILNKTYELTPV